MYGWVWLLAGGWSPIRVLPDLGEPLYLDRSLIRDPRGGGGLLRHTQLSW